MLIAMLFCNSSMSSELDPVNICSAADCINNENRDTSSAIMCKDCIAEILSNDDLALRFYELQSELINERNKHAANESQHIQNLLGENISESADDDADLALVNGVRVRRTKFTDLNVDVLMLIFDELTDAIDTFNLLTVVPDCFWIKYKDYDIRINEWHQFEGINFDNEHKFVKVSTQGATKLLRYFGNVVQELELTAPSNVTIQLINKYASNSLVKLAIDYAREYTFEEFIKPLEKVEQLFIRTFTIIRPGPLSLEEIFPNLRRLIARFDHDVDSSFLFRKFEHLEHFHFSHESQSRNELAKKFFELNPHIRSVEFARLNQNLCSIISKRLPNLERLAVSTHSFTIERETKIEQVKHFQITHSNMDLEAGSMALLRFPNLQSIRIGCNNYISNTWTNFFRKHDHVVRLQIMHVFEHRQLIRLLDELPNLTELILQHSSGVAEPVTPETLSQIIKRHQKLETLKLTGFHFNGNQLDNLREEFQNDWKIVTKEYHQDDHDLVNLLFEKNN